MDSTQQVEQYLQNYPWTFPTEMDEVFGMFKSDVADLARLYRKQEVFIYTKEDYEEELHGRLEGEDLEQAINDIPSHASFIVEVMGIEGYYTI